jgi:DNA-directed RNA polymerase subunit N (RpoN/RPB10)
VAVLTVQLGLTWQRQRAARCMACVEALGQRGRVFRRRVRARESSDRLDSGGVE